MNHHYQQNAKQVSAYDEFINKAWEMGKGGDDSAQQVLKAMLESPEISQKLLSVFFYYNPQTGMTEMMRPSAYIGQFLDNIRELVSDPDRKDLDAFKTIISAFDQMNQERSYIVSNQARVLTEFSEKIATFDKSREENEDDYIVEEEVLEFIDALNKGNLFGDATGKGSFKQIVETGDAKTKNVKSVTGETFGTNKLLRPTAIKGYEVVSDKDFVMPKAAQKPPPSNEIGNVVLPPGSNPQPLVDKVDDDIRIGELWKEHE